MVMITILKEKGALAHGVSSFPKYFVFASLCSFICLQAVYQLSGPVCKATWNGCPSYSVSYLHFTLCKRTGPSSGVVASIVLVSPGLECPGVSLVEVCATCLRCHLW